MITVFRSGSPSIQHPPSMFFLMQTSQMINGCLSYEPGSLPGLGESLGSCSALQSEGFGLGLWLGAKLPWGPPVIPDTVTDYCSFKLCGVVREKIENF